MRLLCVFASLALVSNPSFVFRSDVKNLTVDAADMEQRTTRDGTEENRLSVFITNHTQYEIVLLRGIVCVGREPGTDLDHPDPNCEAVYFGTRFPKGMSAWSQREPLQIEIPPETLVHIRILKIQTVDDDLAREGRPLGGTPCEGNVR